MQGKKLASKKAGRRKLGQAAKGKKSTPRQGKLAEVAAPAGDAPVVPVDIEGDDFSRQAIRLGFLIHDVSRMRRAAYDQLMKPFNFTRARWWVLAHLSRHDGMMQSQLADVLEVGKASLGFVIEQLESDGWVERRPDPHDKRARRVYLKRSAQAFIKKMTAEEDDFNRRILADMNSADRTTLIRLLSTIKESLGKLNLSGNELGSD